MKINRIW